MTVDKNSSTSVLAYEGSYITFELANGEVMVNLTEMAKAFGKRPNDFLGLPFTKQLIESVTRKFGITQSEVVTTIKGNYSNGRTQGTWANRLVALSFAQWLSVDFHLICLEKIEELLFAPSKLTPLYGVSPTVIDGKVLYCYHDALKALGASTRSGRAYKRKGKYPQCFVKAFGRNFITADYLHYMHSCRQVYQLQINFRNQREEGVSVW